MKNKKYLAYFIFILLSVFISHLFYINQTTYFKTDITIKVGRYYHSNASKPILIEEIPMVIQRLRSKNFIFDNFSKKYQKYIPLISTRTFRNGDALVLSLITKKKKPDEKISYKKIMETVANGMIQSHEAISKKIMDINADELFTRTQVTNKAVTYTHKKYTSYAQILFIGIIISIILLFSLEKLIFYRKKKQ
ncbi:hypothetical protein OAN90_04290 [Gammaproteobacteria bacterium]|nr:hypothetical protein [Gammaproteobacteria bacterium]